MVNVTDRSAGGKFLAFVARTTTASASRPAAICSRDMVGKGNVVILEGVKGSLTNVDRCGASIDALKEFKDVKLLASQPPITSACRGCR